MATVTIAFTYSNGDTDYADFYAHERLIAEITDYIDDAVSSLNDDIQYGAEEITCDGWEVFSYGNDYNDQQSPYDFKDLDDWGDYCEKCDRHGNIYCRRYADIGENDFESEYVGYYSSFLHYARTVVDNCYDLDEFAKDYFDYDKFADDLEADYSTYRDLGGVHIFLDT